MTKFIRTNQKKILAIFAAFLMIAFIWQTAMPRGPLQGGSGIVIGHIGDQKITLDQQRRGEMEWEMLARSILVPTNRPPPYPQFASVLEALSIPPPQFMQEMKDHPETYALLLEEAGRMGARVNEASLDAMLVQLAVQLPDRRIVPYSDAPEAVREQVRQVVYDFLSIEYGLERATDVVKVSQPLVQFRLVSGTQSATLRLVDFDAKQFLAAAPDPTPEQLQRQFESFATTDPQQVEHDPDLIGFGYQFPNRVKFQYISIPRDEIVKVVKATKDDYNWELEAHRYYLRNQREFPTQSDPAATQPSTAPTTKPFDEVRGTILERVMQPEVDRITREIQTRIQNSLTNEYEKHQAASGPTTAPASTQPVAVEVTTSTPSSLGVPYESYDYLKKLAENIQKEFGVLPAVGMIGEYKSADEIDKIKGIGEAHMGPATFGIYATFMAEPLLPPERRNMPQMLSLLKPSPPISDASSNIYIARIMAADPTHRPADIAEIADRVKADWKKQWAYDQAKAAATKLVEAARSSSFDQAAGDSTKIITAGPFDEYNTGTIPGIEIPNESLNRFRREAFKLVSEAARAQAGAHPVGVIELPHAEQVYAAELQTVRSDPQLLQSYVAMSQANRELTREFAAPIVMNWFTYRGVVSRLNYVDETKRPAKAAAD